MGGLRIGMGVYSSAMLVGFARLQQCYESHLTHYRLRVLPRWLSVPSGGSAKLHHGAH